MTEAIRSWLELTACHPDVDLLDEALFAAGAVSVTLTDAADSPILEPALGTHQTWPRTHVTGLFSGDTDEQLARAAVSAAVPAAVLTARWVEDRDWVRAWMDDYTPMQFGRRLWVCPAGMALPEAADRDAVVITLDPGLAFGTGTHPTTAMCLRWLDGAPLAGARVLDYGCGSGILAIAAARLGAAQVLATDIDPQALLATDDNAQRNGVAVDTCLPEALPDSERFDIVLANILAGPLADLAPRLIGHLRPGGQLALAGLLDTQVDALVAAYAPAVPLRAGARSGQWVRLDGQKMFSTVPN